MRKFTQLLLALALTIVGVEGVKANETHDISLDASKWTKGWNATATNYGDNLAITLTADYGAKGIPLTETTATPLSSCNKICVVIESYSGGWGQLIVRSNGADLASKAYGTVTTGSPQTITIQYNPADNIDEFLIQCGTDNPTVTVSRVYLVEKSDEPIVSSVSGFGDEITSLSDIIDGTRFAIGDGTNVKYWTTASSDNQSGSVKNVPSDSYYYYKLEKVEGLDTDNDGKTEDDNYRILIVNSSNEPVTCGWNFGHYINYSIYTHLFAASARVKEGSDTYTYGHDGDYYAIWKVAYSAGNGFTLKNAGINKYATVAGSSDAVTYLKFYKSIDFTSTTMYPANDEIFALSKATGYNAETGEMTNGTWTFDTPVDLSNWKYIIIAMENGCADDSHDITITDNNNISVHGNQYDGTVAGTGPEMYFSRWNHQNIGCISLDYLKNTKGMDIEHIKSLSIAGTTKPFVVYLSSYDNSKLLSTNRWFLYKEGDLVRNYVKTEVGKFGTVCLPYKASCAGAEVYSIAGKEGEGINLTKINGLLEAGKPYFYMASDAVGQDNHADNVDKHNVNFFRADFDEYDSANPISSNGLIGTFTSMTAPAGANYYILSGNKLYDTDGCTGESAVTVGANKAYINTDRIVSTSSSRSAFILFDETTGINTVQGDVVAKQVGIFNLNGQRLSQLKKGLNIINGKKVLVK